MSVFLRYLISLMAHLAWQRMGNRGPVPPLRLSKKSPTALPVIGSWQLMAAMWVINRFWQRYGNEIRSRLLDAKSSALNRAASMLPSQVLPPAPSQSVSTTATRSPQSAATPAPRARYDTQPLPAQSLPAGSVLSGLRPPSPHSPRS